MTDEGPDTRRPASLRALLTRAGFVDAGAAPAACSRTATWWPCSARSARTARCSTCWSGAASPDDALLARAPGSRPCLSRTATRCAAMLTEPGAARDRLVAVLGASPRSATTWCGTRGPRGARRAEPDRPDAAAVRAELLAAVGADPDAPVPVAGAGGRGRRRDAPGLPAPAADDRGSGPRRRRAAVVLPAVGSALADLAGAALEAGLALARADQPDHGARRALAVIGMGKTGGRELNYVSDVDVIYVAEPAEGATRARRSRVATRLAAGRPGRAPRRPGSPPCGRWTLRCGPEGKQGRWSGPSRATWRTTSAGRRPGSSRRCSRHGWWRGTGRWAAPTARRWGRWCGGPSSGRTSSRTPRRCGVASRSTSRRRRPTARSSSAREGCATSSSPSSCSSWCTAARTSRSAARTPCPRCRRCPPAATSAVTTRRGWRSATGCCACSSTGSSCTGCGAPT